jgi:hypothetical protein
LQKAKIDLIDDASMSQFHSPQYWSHLIFIGDVQEQKSNLLWIVIGATLAVTILLILKRKYRKDIKINLN